MKQTPWHIRSSFLFFSPLVIAPSIAHIFFQPRLAYFGSTVDLTVPQSLALCFPALCPVSDPEIPMIILRYRPFRAKGPLSFLATCNKYYRYEEKRYCSDYELDLEDKDIIRLVHWFL